MKTIGLKPKSKPIVKPEVSKEVIEPKKAEEKK